MKNNGDKIYSSISFIVFLVSWEILARLNVIDSRFFPEPSKIFLAGWILTKNGELWNHLSISLIRIILGFLMGSIPGLILGLIMGMSRTVRIIVDPLVSATYPLPKITLLPLIMLIFGIGELSKVIIIAIACFYLVLINAAVGVRGIPPILFEAGINQGARKVNMFFHIILPGALPTIFAGLRLGLGVALIIIVAAEFLASERGIGYLIWVSWQTLLTENMYVGFVVIAILGVLTTEGLKKLEVYFMPWERGRIENEI
jgi:ABC-type nitrate/sulfonate/bicarbonate transport system permease component